MPVLLQRPDRPARRSHGAEARSDDPGVGTHERAELEPATMATHAKDDGGPPAGHHGRADAKRNDQRAVTRKCPTIAGDVRSAEHDRQHPQKNAGDYAQEADHSSESWISLGLVDGSGHRAASYLLTGFVGCSYRHLTRGDHYGRVINAIAEPGEDAGDILLIGGESDAAEMYRMKLVLDGYRVITVADLGDASARRDGWRPDLVLIDLGAGVGAQLRDLRRLRADPLLSGVPALLLSTRSEEELRQRGITLGPMDYVLRTG